MWFARYCAAQKNGYLAQPFDVNDFIKGIKYVLDESLRSNELALNARKAAIEKFDIRNVTQQYITLYKSLLVK
jgi:glycosyltransferase involved in cell wall biosynthesis